MRRNMSPAICTWKLFFIWRYVLEYRRSRFVCKCNNTVERVVCRGTLCLVSAASCSRQTEMLLKSTTFLTNALKSVWVFYVVIFTACTVFWEDSPTIPTCIVSYKWSFRTLLKYNCHCCLNKLITMWDYLVLCLCIVAWTEISEIKLKMLCM